MNEGMLRLGFFIFILALMLGLEQYRPARNAALPKRTRWSGNFAIMILSAIIARLTIPLGVAGAALFAQQQQWGLFNLTTLPLWLTITLSLVLLDLLIYWQHRLFHQWPILWRLHQVHHSDSHVDASTGLRFHPLEILLSIIIKIAAVIILGVPVLAVLIFEIALNGFALFNHANIRLPHWLERPLRLLLITQILHRIHHSQIVSETNSNYGFSVSWWDRLFGSYKDKANLTDDKLIIGLKTIPATTHNARLRSLLLLPFRK